MTQSEIQELKRALVATALYYGETIPDEALQLYAADLADLALPDLLAALTAYRRNPKSRRRPLPADLRALAAGEETPEGRAREIAARLHGALVRYGMDWPAGFTSCGRRWYAGLIDGRTEGFYETWDAAARATLGGDDSLRVLERLGGWQGYYQYANFADPTTVAAQIRDLAVAVLRAPARPAGPALPAGTRAALAGGSGAGTGRIMTVVGQLAERFGAPQEPPRDDDGPDSRRSSLGTTNHPDRR